MSALTPNGRFLDLRRDPPRTSPTRRSAIPKTSYISGLYASGAASGFYSPPGVDRNADLTTWNAQIDPRRAGDAATSARSPQRSHEFHQGFGLELSRAGAPPAADPAGLDRRPLPRPRGSARLQRPAGAGSERGTVSLQFADLGHARGQNKQAVDEALNTEGAEFLDQHVLRSGNGPAAGSVVAYTQTCPKAAPAGGPFRASSWERIHPGSVRQSFVAEQTVQSGGGDPETARALDPVAGGGACVQVNDRDASGTAVYRLPVKDAFTLMGQPTITRADRD